MLFHLNKAGEKNIYVQLGGDLEALNIKCVSFAKWHILIYQEILNISFQRYYSFTSIAGYVLGICVCRHFVCVIRIHTQTHKHAFYAIYISPQFPRALSGIHDLNGVNITSHFYSWQHTQLLWILTAAKLR